MSDTKKAKEGDCKENEKGFRYIFQNGEWLLYEFRNERIERKLDEIKEMLKKMINHE